MISVLNLLKEPKSREFQLNYSTHVVMWRNFEDNKSCIEIATNNKRRPETKHLSVSLHNFCSYIIDKTISIEHILTFGKIANMFTKPLARDQFCKLRNHLIGWSVNVRE